MGKVIEAKQIVKPKKRRHRLADTNDGPPHKAPKLLYSDPANVKTPYSSQGEDDQEKVILQEEVYADLISPDSVCLKIKTEELYDLFLDDELTNSYFCYSKDFYYHIIDEIALEGLDGITIEAFWKRISVCLQKPFYRNTNIELLIWQIILDNDSLKFYKLVDSRKPLTIFNRYNYVDPEQGNLCDMPPLTPDMYPYNAVTAENVQGSCSTFDTRVNITEVVKQMSLREVLKKFGPRLVIVADQDVRTSALLFEMTDPVLQLVPQEYGMLERIGRGRYHGELTAGMLAISQALNMDNKSMHHYQKRLLSNHLITKQQIYLKSLKEDQNATGNLLTLSRFYHKIKPKQLIVTDKVVHILKNMPNYRCEMRRLSEIFKNNYKVLRKVLKTTEFKRFVRPDISSNLTTFYNLFQQVPYRALYPEASRDEYMRKSKLVERTVRICELIDPNEVDATGEKYFNMNISREVYMRILQSGNTGMTTMDVLKAMGMNFYIIRMALRKLLARDIITKKLTDGGRQRYAVYYAKCLGTQDESEEKIDTKPKIEEVSSIKARMIEKQRAAIQKRGCEDYVLTCSEMPACGIERCCKKSMNIERNSIPTCVFLIKDVHPMEATSVEEDLNLNRCLSRYYLIKLKYVSNGKQLPINDWLTELSPKVHLDKENLRHIYIDHDKKFKSDFITKLILLKLSFEEIELSKESFESHSRKRKLSSSSLPAVAAPVDKAVDEKLNYMGNDPEIVWRNEEGGLEEIMEMSTRPTEYRYDTVFSETENLSEKVATRLQLLLDLVNKVKVLDDMILNMVRHIEDIEVKADLKVLPVYVTIFLQRLRQSVTQVKFKYFIGAAKKNVKPTEQEQITEESGLEAPFRQGDVIRSVTEWNSLKRRNKKTENHVMKTSLKIARLYGSKPKFIRLRILHDILYYLTYVYKSPKEPIGYKEVRELFRTYCIELSEDELDRMPPIYCKELSWRTFIGPLPEHKGWPSGWTLLLDVIMRLPVCMFLKLHSCTVECPQLSDILNHPIKRFYLVKDLSQAVRNAILFRGRYSASMYELVSRLAFCGLVQFGPQKSKDKEQIFIYVNRTASLYDTSSSETGYNKVTDKEYPQLIFHFNSLADIESYWAQLHCISMNTKLNTRVPGQLVTYTDLSANPSLRKALDFKMPHEAEQYDNGDIPGDRRGAAGLDSSLWCHINRNWHFAGRNKMTALDIRMENENIEKSDSSALIPFNQLNKINRKVYLLKVKPFKPIRIENKHGQSTINQFRTSKTNKLITRVVKPRNNLKKKRAYQDHIDRLIVKQIGPKKRVKFSKEEDRLLTLCKAGDMLLGISSTSGYATVSYVTIRDIMHRVSPESRNKTCRALDRRIRYHLRERISEENVWKLKDVPEIKKYLMPFVNALNYPKGNRPKDQIRNVYVTLMAYMFQNQNEILNLIQENLEEKSTILFKEAVVDSDIAKDCIKSVVLASLFCSTSSVRLFKVYERYSDDLIREAVLEMKKAHMISNRRKTMQLRAQIVWQVPYKLSNKFHYLLGTIYDYTTAIDAYEALKLLEEPNETRIIDWTPGLANSIMYGRLLGFNEFFSMWDRVRFKFNVPESTIILNPDIEDHSALVNEIAVRFQIKIKRMLQEKAEPDPEEEEEEEIDHQSTHTDADYESTQTKPAASQSKFKPDFEEDIEAPEESLDVDMEANNDTIDRLKSWVSDCMKVERRSPSPEFMVDARQLQGNSSRTTNNDEGDENVEQQTISVEEKKNERSLKFDYVPTLDEIKEELMKITPLDQDRRIPYITELNDLLNRDNFNENKIKDEDLTILKKHFVAQYTVLENVILDDFEQLYDSPALKFIEDQAKNVSIWKKVKDDLFAKDLALIPNVNEAIEMAGGAVEDMEISQEILEFIMSKGVFGAAGPELQRMFAYVEKHFLVTNVIRLVDAGILIRVGICSLRFVHYTHRSQWLIDAYQISADEQNEDEEYVKTMAKRLEGSPKRSIRVVLWSKIDGQLDEQILRQWLCRILSHVINNPKTSFWNILQEIGCVKLYTYSRPENHNDIFSDWVNPSEEFTTVLDDFEDVCIQPTNIAMIALGSFYHTLTIPSI
nr:unnamed protein product [Callosobruchus chinensis]